MLAIRDILIAVNRGQIGQFKKISINGNNLGLKLVMPTKMEPRGLPDAFIVGETER